MAYRADLVVFVAVIQLPSEEAERRQNFNLKFKLHKLHKNQTETYICDVTHSHKLIWIPGC